MDDDQKMWNEQRAAMIADCRKRISLTRQSIEDAQEALLDARKAKDNVGAKLAEEELKEAQDKLIELHKELERLEESVCF